ncbi:hypothetical protein [Brachybacterium paraconglomeratum]|uniref:hypothetical protein n=1 Tax=Brachybacterium paraconglomeratum TaxID=173362 RepID=UPI0022AED04D|nr:hypothetical protein [Brachybacterium paraconglomeratum]MCZ4325716.1 hypothetical protein [Brachybacterium paraconglomeratum]
MNLENRSSPAANLIAHLRDVREDITSPDFLQLRRDQMELIGGRGVVDLLAPDALDEHIAQLHQAEDAAVQGAVRQYVRELAESDASGARELLDSLREELDGHAEVPDTGIDSVLLREAGVSGSGAGEVGGRGVGADGRVHDASPSAGAGETPSVGGDQAAGGRFPDSPAADPAEPASLADEVFALRGEVFAVREMTRTVLDGIAQIAEGFRLRSRRRPPHPIDQETES